MEQVWRTKNPSDKPTEGNVQMQQQQAQGIQGNSVQPQVDLMVHTQQQPVILQDESAQTTKEDQVTVTTKSKGKAPTPQSPPKPSTTITFFYWGLLHS